MQFRKMMEKGFKVTLLNWGPTLLLSYTSAEKKNVVAFPLCKVLLSLIQAINFPYNL